MNRQILIGLAGLAMASVALGRTDSAYINDRVQIFNPPAAPPVIDATNFINNSAFIDNTFNSLYVTPYETANTVYYTNFGVLGAIEGFRFDTFNTHTARYTNAGSFHNEVGAIVNCGGTNDGAYFSTNASFFTLGGAAECVISATNILNRGTIEMGPDSLLSLQGQNINLAGGILTMEGFESGNLLGDSGIFPGYWGLRQTPAYNPASVFTPLSPSSPTHSVTNRNYSVTQRQLTLPLANAYVNSFQGPSNFLWQVVFLQNADPSVSNNVYFAGTSVVEWVWPSTNVITGMAQTNFMYLDDGMIIFTNLALVTNGVAPPNTGYRPTYVPTNYAGSFFVGGPMGIGAATSPGLPAGIFGPNKNITTEYTAYEAIFLPTTVILSELANQNFSNIPGRIEVTADKQLDLSSSSIAGLNYLRLTATNNFTQDPDTRILTAVADYNLGVTNATLTVSNLLAPTCPRLNGYVDVFSTRWTNIDNASPLFPGTNTYFVTMVDSHLSSALPSAVQNLTLHATNVVISDVLNVLSNITIDAYNVTITTNGPGAQTPFGQLNFPPGQDLGAGAFPRLLTFTNYGLISVQNAAVFGTAAQPLWDFVNHGSVLAQGCDISATNFENTGLIEAGPGHAIVSANTAVFSNGVMNALFNDIVVRAGSLLISNQALNAGHSLTIWATNSLDDGGPASGNFWTSGVLGFSLPFEPPIASLLGTTITDTIPPNAKRVTCQWAGQDRGPVAAGYSNNAALGRLILDGGTPGSSFVFNAPAGTNALYVDYLEFRNNMTNFDSSGNLANLSFGPNMKIYYAQLILNGVSFAEKLNHKNTNNWNGYGLNWVPAYAGAFSSTNMVYPDGTTNRLNLALVQSCDLDSNGNGIANCQDPAPVFVPSQVGLTAALTNLPQRSVVLSWNSIPNATNSLFAAASVAAPNWQRLTNFVAGSVGGRQRFVDPIGAGSRFYRVRVDAPTP